MAAPTYTSDLTTIVDFDGTPASPTVAEPSAPWADGRSPAVDTDFPIQGTNHASLTMNTTGKAGIVCSNASSFTWTSGNYLFGWLIWLAPGAIATRANGGLSMLCGSATSAYKVFYVGGSDFGSYPYGGWQNFAVDPTLTPDETVGTPTDYYIVGGGANVLSAVAKGNPLGFDVFRYGRGELRIANGSLADGYANFSGSAAFNDSPSNRLGLFQEVDGGYKWKGLLYFGFGAPTEFVDSNKSIVIDESLYVNSDFNRIEVHNISSRIEWNNISITSLSSISRGQFEMVDNCPVTHSTCVFTDMDTFKYQSSASIDNSTFRRCNEVFHGGATFNNSTFDKTTGTTALTGSNLSLITGTTFISDGSSHAYEIDTPGTYTWVNNVVEGYATANGSTGNEVIYNNSGGAVIINKSGGSGIVSYRNGTGASTTINDTVNVTLTGMKDGTEVRVFLANTTTEIAGIETVIDGTLNNRSYTFSYAGNTSVDIVVHSLSYESLRINGYLIPTTAASIPIQQRFDRTYLNPV